MENRILGANKRYYPSEFNPMNPPVTMCVLVEGDIGDYAAYIGHGSPQWVAKWGNKISFDEACCHFPGGQLDKERYRER